MTTQDKVTVVFALALLLAILVYLFAASGTLPDPQLRADPAQSAAASAVASGMYPPMGIAGALNAMVTQATIGQTICNKNWSTKSIRPPASYTTKLKKQQLAQYGYADTNPADYEEDHLISLELGGNPTSPNNLWPELWEKRGGKVAAAGTGAESKDLVENYMHKQVCSGALPLATAQQEIANDWYQLWIQINRVNSPQTFGALQEQTSSDPDDN